MVRLPADDYDYRADEKPGAEKIILIASLAPLGDIEYFSRKFTQGKADPSDSTLLAKEIETRDIGVAPSIVSAVRQENTLPNPQLEIERLTGRGTLVRTLVFEHR